ncbi:MAG: hypothetical protein ABWX92_03280 [Mycetocola sp.]
MLWQVLLHVSLWNRSENLHSVPLRDRAKPLVINIARRDRAGKLVEVPIACGT